MIKKIIITAGMCLLFPIILFSFPTSITKTSSSTGSFYNDYVTFYIYYENVSAGNVSNYEIYDTVPAEVSWTNNGGAAVTGDLFTWSIGDLGAGAGGSILWIGRITSYPSGTGFDNYASDSEGASRYTTVYVATASVTMTNTPAGTQTFTPSVTPTFTPTNTPAAGLADLIITGMDSMLEHYTGPGDCWYPGDQLGTRVYFSNIGGDMADMFIVDLDGNTIMVTLLDSGESGSVWFPSAAHPDPATAIIDSTDMVVEADEGNNTYQQTLSTPTPPPTCSPTGGTATNTFTPTRTATPTFTNTWYGTPTYTSTVTPSAVVTACDAWVDADGAGQDNIIVFNSNYVFEPIVRLDNSENPHIAWSDFSTAHYQIYYLKWNGSAWVDADGIGQESVNVSNSSGFSTQLSMCLDGTGNPHIAWSENLSPDSDIYYLKWNGSAWVDADGAGQESIKIYDSVEDSIFPSLSLDSSGNPHIAWRDGPASNFEIYYLKWNGSAWVDVDGSGQEGINVSNTIENSEKPSLRLDSLNNPHIAWSDGPLINGEIYYLKWNGSSWVDADGTGQESVNVSNNSGDSEEVFLRLDSFENAGIIWRDDTTGGKDVYYLKWNGSSWVDADGTGQESINVSNNSGDSWKPSFVFDSSGNPHITWFDYTMGDPDVYYLKWNGSSWVDVDGAGQESIIVQDNTGGSHDSSLVLDSFNNPHIAWRDNTISGYNDLYYLKWEPCITGGTPTFTRTIYYSPEVTSTITRTITETITPTVTETITMTGTPDSYPYPGDGVVLHHNAGGGNGDDCIKKTYYDEITGKWYSIGLSWNDDCSCYVMIIWRFNLDGSLDLTFGGGNGYIECPGPATSYIWEADIDIKISITGQIYITGYVEGCGGTCTDMILYCLNSDGTLNTSFGGGLGYVTYENAKGCSIYIHEETGMCYVTGQYWNGTSYEMCVWRYFLSTGILDTTFGGGTGCVRYNNFAGGTGDDKATSCYIGIDDKLYIAGDSPSNDPGCTGSCRAAVIIRCNPADGSLETSTTYINPAIGHSNCRVVKIIIDVYGRIYAAMEVDDGSCGDISCRKTVIVRYRADFTLDLEFNLTGYFEYSGGSGCIPKDIMFDPDGKLLIVGEEYNGVDKDIFCVKLNDDGSFDTGFDSDGIYTYDSGNNDSASCVQIDINWNIIISGSIEVWYNGNDALIYRCPIMIPSSTPTPTPDDFTDGIIKHDSAAGGGGNDCGKKMVKLPDGKKLIAGLSYDSECSCYIIVVWRINLDGTIDFTFGNGKGFVKCGHPQLSILWSAEVDIVLNADGSFYVTSYAPGCGGTCTDLIIFKFTAKGVLDLSFGGNGFVTHHNAAGGNSFDRGIGITVDNSGRILVSGCSTNASGDCSFTIWRYTITGILDVTFGGGNGFVTFDNIGGGVDIDVAVDIKVDLTGKIYVLGNTSSSDAGCTGSCRAITMWKLNDDGTPDTSFGGGDGHFEYINTAISHSECTATSLYITATGEIYITGYINDGSGCDLTCSQMIIIKLTVTGILDITFNTTGIVTHAGCGGAKGMDIKLDACGKIVIGGTCDNAGLINAIIWRFETTGLIDTALGGGLGYEIYDSCGAGCDDFGFGLEVDGCGDIYLVGESRTDKACGGNCRDMFCWKFEDGSTPTMSPTASKSPTATTTWTVTETITQVIETPTFTPTAYFGESELNLVSGMAGDSCAVDTVSYVMQIQNKGVGPVSTDRIKARLWFNSTFTPEINIINCMIQPEGAWVTATASVVTIPDCVESADRKANKYIELEFSYYGIPPAGGYMDLSFSVSGASPFDAECDDYSRLESGIIDRPYVCLYWDDTLMTEYLSIGVVDPMTGVEPCSGAGTPTFTPTTTMTAAETATPTVTATSETGVSVPTGITKTADDDTPYIGQYITYTIDYENTSTSSIANYTIWDTVPAGLYIDSVNNGGVQSGNYIVWDLEVLSAGASGSVSYVAYPWQTIDSVTVNTAMDSAGAVATEVIYLPTSTYSPTSTLTFAITASYTDTPTFTPTNTFTATPTYTSTFTMTATPTASPTATQPCPAGTPQFTVNAVYNPENSDYVIIEIESSVPLADPPGLTVVPHGDSSIDKKQPVVLTSEPILGETQKYRAYFPKTTGWGDIEKIIVTGADVCGQVGVSDGSYTKEVISKKDVVIFNNVIKPDLGERARIVFKTHANDFGAAKYGNDTVVKVYNRNGKFIGELFNSRVDREGQLEVMWDGRNDNGEIVASGIYIVVVETPYYIEKAKIGVIR